MKTQIKNWACALLLPLLLLALLLYFNDDEEDSYTLLNSIDIPSGPVMVIAPYVSGAYGKLLILDAERREIARR